MLRIYTLALGLFGIQIACQMTFTSLGNAKASIIVAVMRKFILLLPLIYIMPHLYTTDLTKAVFMAEPVADVLAVAFTGVLFFFEFRKALRAMPKARKEAKSKCRLYRATPLFCPIFLPHICTACFFVIW